MALNDEIRRERAKLKGKGVKAHLAYFWDYYKIPAILGTVAVVIIISMIVSIASAKDTALEVVLLNSAPVETETAVNGSGASFADYAAVDTDQEEVIFDTGLSLTPGTRSGQYDYANLMKITAEVAAREIDVMVADAWNFNYYANQGMFTDLREVYSEEELAALEGKLYYVDQAVITAYEENSAADESVADAEMETEEDARASETTENFVLPDPDEMEDPVPVGIVCTDAPYIAGNSLYPGVVPVVGIMVNTERMETAVQFLSYIWE